MNDIWDKFDSDHNLIKEYKHWKLLIRKNHTFLGSCVAITREHHDLLGDLSPEEMAEYRIVAHELESALKKAFQFDAIHHCMLMMEDKHTHFHILPRYKTDREFAGITWAGDFSKNPLGRHNEVSQEVLDGIKNEIIKFI